MGVGAGIDGQEELRIRNGHHQPGTEQRDCTLTDLFTAADTGAIVKARRVLINMALDLVIVLVIPVGFIIRLIYLLAKI
jgi:hypothetical protein